jgi:hypothetical protein
MNTAFDDTAVIPVRTASIAGAQSARSSSARTARSTGAPAAPRVDLYVPIHKALRSMMAETLVLVGRLDVSDADEMNTTLAQFDSLLDLCTSHIAHENAFVHTAIEARQPAGAQRTADDHLEHLQSIDALRSEGRSLRAAPDHERMGLALRLYRHLALFVAENIQHMHIEETANNAALWSNYSDAELIELHGRLLASIPPHENLEVARWMVPALSPIERAVVVNGARAAMPPAAFLGVVDRVRPHIDARGWPKLARAIGVGEHPAEA